MPVLAWRNDADGFAFGNNWTLDATERAALTALAQPLIPAAVATTLAIIPDPILWFALWPVLTTAANGYLAFGTFRTYGLCGGMAYSALDHWNARVPIPRGANSGDQPARTAPAAMAIRDSLWRRLLDSLGPGGVLKRTLEWSLLLNQVPKEFGGGPEGLKNRTLLEWDLIRSHIDAGRPWPIGLVISNRDVWDQHQILVYGYENTGLNQGKLYICENNLPSQFGRTEHGELTLNFSGPTLIAPRPSGTIGTLAGFFCSNYFPDMPVGMSKSYGEFLSWTGDARTWMVTDGARMPIADPTELSALGGTAQSVRPTESVFDSKNVRPRDGAMFRERSSAPVFVYAGGAPFLIPDPMWLDRFGGVGQVRVVPDNTIAAFNGLPDEGTLLREWSDPKVWLIMTGVRRWVTTPEELAKWGGFPSVRVVPDGALAPIAVGQPLSTPSTPQWNWSNMGKPQGANIRALMGAVTVMDTPTSPQRPHVFVEGNDFSLWCCWYPGSGTAWNWSNMGKPQGANIRALMGAVTAMDTPSSPQRPHLFVEGNDFNLWCLWYPGSGTVWNWTNMGKPPGANISGMVGAVTVMDTTTSPQRPHVFVAGNDGNLWCRWSDGSAWHWLNMGKPQGANIHSPMGALTVMDTPSSAQRPHVFVLGNDGNLWLDWWG